ncbi:MAG: hypothetical protein EP338_14010 [Bacteroidetes bacterium]|nr:MAG: hypothetical protein EP338_14010 [Bacteroidota bacterium]
MRKVAWLLIFLIPFAVVSWGQEHQQDSLPRHSVRKAAIFSACIPGAGQIYNHRAMPKGKRKAFWKVPLIYAGLGASTYFMLENQRLQLELKQEYTNRLNGVSGLDQYLFYDDFAILQLYKQHLSRRDLFITGMLAVYMVQILDAAVEAHFVHFDVSEDLSLSMSPTISYGGTPGVRLCLKFVK